MSEKNQFKPQTLRNYQAEVFEIASKQNSIICLPTGSGKTCVAVWLIRHFAADLKKPYRDGGKRTIFIVNTVELSYQQAKYVLTVGGFNVRVVCSKEGVDHWNRQQWMELEDFEVIVMTSQCYLNGLCFGYMKLERANLLIFDECHHAVGSHPMCEIMSRFSTLSEGNPGPRVLGLSATILNHNVKNQDQLVKELETLESTFRAIIVGSTMIEEIAKFATKPKETIKHFEKYPLSDDVENRLVEWKEISTTFALAYRLSDDDTRELLLSRKPGAEDILMNVPGSNRCNMLINTIEDIVVHCREFGVYVALICCHYYFIQLHRFMLALESTPYVDLVLYFINITRIFRKILYDEVMKFEKKPVTGYEFSMEAMSKASTKKLDFLFGVLRDLKSTDKCILFVERKMTAKVLNFIIKRFIVLVNASNIRVDFITGSDCNPLRNTRELMHDKKERHKILESFRGNELNVLISTNVLEEGIDIPNCGLVIMFDELKSYRSYIQSKGRARLSTSQYLVLNDVPPEKFDVRLSKYRDIETTLKKYILSDEASDEDNESNESPENCEYYTTSENACINEVNSIALIVRYCSSLPRDLFTKLVPYWWLSPENGDKVCKLQLPVNSSIRQIINGPPRSNFKKAKQAVAFLTVKQLHQLGSLDDRLRPFPQSVALKDIREWVPHWNESEAENAYSADIKRPKFLNDSRPVANKKCYLHLIDIKTEHEKPEIDRYRFCHDLLNSSCNFGIITRSRSLPKLCSFPIYSDLGRVRVIIRTNILEIPLSEFEMNWVIEFHKSLFLYVLRTVPKCFLYDPQDSFNYFIVPLVRTNSGIEIAWKLIRQNIEPNITRPSVKERERKKFREEKYLGKVVVPWYRTETNPKYYIVTKFHTGYYLNSEMDRKLTFKQHLKKQYDLDSLQPDQPMMEVRAITNMLESIKPRPVSSSSKLKKRKNLDNKTYLAPEFVCTQSLPSEYWYKSTLLPSILHRFEQLLLAEDFRQKMVEEAGVGRMNVNIDEEKVNKYFMELEESTTPVETVSENQKVDVNERKKSTNKYSSPSVKDIYHRDDLMNLTLGELEKFVDYIDEPVRQVKTMKATSSQSHLMTNGKCQNYAVRFVDPPSLNTLKEYNHDCQGPNQYELLQAFTLRHANDSINLERFETLGDSLLKYLVSFAIFLREEKMNEGLLTSLKGRIISNKYLFDCATKHQIPSYIQTIKFTVENGWVPPSFSVPDLLRNYILKEKNFPVLHKIDIPHQEQFSGEISVETIDSIRKALYEYARNYVPHDETENEEISSLFYLGKLKLRHKPIADVVEALIGVYLETCGIEGAFKVMKYLGILEKESYTALKTHRTAPVGRREDIDRILFLIPNYRNLERLLNYTFRDKGLLLQAVTHPSCMTNLLTDCYQKLEFIGDAVLDFLITSYIYEYCGKLSPGQITDLRSALVNNNTFGALAVRLGLNLYLLNHSKSLEDAIALFVSYQKEKKFEIHGNELMLLLNENDTIIAEEVDIPKALGDVFEALAGAIFIDSKYDLKLVWKIYYSIMAEEIDKFFHKIPINPVRALYEMSDVEIEFDKIVSDGKEGEDSGNKLKVRLRIRCKNEGRLITFIGRGLNSATAKRAAAKLALRHFKYSDFVI